MHRIAPAQDGAIAQLDLDRGAFDLAVAYDFDFAIALDSSLS